jgi:hypothetical protein
MNMPGPVGPGFITLVRRVPNRLPAMLRVVSGPAAKMDPEVSRLG